MGGRLLDTETAEREAGWAGGKAGGAELKVKGSARDDGMGDEGLLEMMVRESRAARFALGSLGGVLSMSAGKGVPARAGGWN